MASSNENPRNPPRPPRNGCPQDTLHSCFHCSTTWRCPTCTWPLVLDDESGARHCLHCEGIVLTEREWSVVARTGLPPSDLHERRHPAPTAADGALDDATLAVTTRLVAARAAHANAASDFDLARTALRDATAALREAERAMLEHFDLNPDGDR